MQQIVKMFDLEMLHYKTSIYTVYFRIKKKKDDLGMAKTVLKSANGWFLLFLLIKHFCLHSHHRAQ